jgi:hypothetical protein
MLCVLIEGRWTGVSITAMQFEKTQTRHDQLLIMLGLQYLGNLLNFGRLGSEKAVAVPCPCLRQQAHQADCVVSRDVNCMIWQKNAQCW